MNATPSRIPDWLLERLVAGDLPAERATELRRRLATEPDGEARVRALEESNREVLARLPAGAMAEAIRARLGRRRRSFLLLAPAAAAVTLVAVLAVRFTAGTHTENGALESTRSKGDPRLLILRQKEPSAERLRSGDAVHAGDTLQVVYVAGGRSYGLVLSLDGNGVVTRHLPEGGARASALKRDGAVALPHSFELDDAPGYERFFLITSPRPFEVEPVVAAARELARRRADASHQSLKLPPSLEQSSFLLRKVAP